MIRQLVRIFYNVLKFIPEVCPRAYLINERMSCKITVLQLIHVPIPATPPSLLVSSPAARCNPLAGTVSEKE
jgi:hypothetical protein